MWSRLDVCVGLRFLGLLCGLWLVLGYLLALPGPLPLGKPGMFLLAGAFGADGEILILIKSRRTIAAIIYNFLEIAAPSPQLVGLKVHSTMSSWSHPEVGWWPLGTFGGHSFLS